MINFPAEILIGLTIKPGAVYYFTESNFSSPEPHYFIVLNYNPSSDEFLALVCASSQIEKVKRRRKNCPCETLVEVPPHGYSEFTRHTVIDCNEVAQYTIEDLINKINKSELKIKPEIDNSLLSALRSAVQKSPLVPIKTKKLLQNIS